MADKMILCVDDDRDVLNALREMLENGGYSVLQAGSGEEALKVFREKGADLVIADLMMETIDAGVQLVKDLKIEQADLPVIMMSSVGDDLNMATDYSDLRLAGVLQKPAKPEALLKLVSAKLAGGAL